MEIFKAFTFDAAHHLPNCPPGHRCRRPHGHSYRIEIHLSGEPHPDTGWIIDFGEIKKAVQPVVDQIDHQYLNEIEGLENPTTETLVVWLWERVKPVLGNLSKIVVYETCTSGCVYTGPKD